MYYAAIGLNWCLFACHHMLNLILFVLSLIFTMLYADKYPALKTLFSKSYVKRPFSKRPKIGFQYQLALNAGQKYCRMFHLEHSAILSTFIKVPFVIKIFILAFF